MNAQLIALILVLSCASVASQQVLCVTCVIPPPCNTCQPNRDPVTWAQWGEWGPCTQQGGYTAQSRVRTCDALSCDTGLSQEARACEIQRDPPTVPPPTWSSWTEYGQCSASCGGGIQQRTRTCNNLCNVCQCQGPSTEQRQCNTQPCCTWTAWSPWSECSATCGSGGYKSRTRQCSCFTGCTGATSEQQTCSAAAACPTPAPPTTCVTCQPPVVINPCTTCYNPCVTCGYYGKKKREAAMAARLRGPGPQIPSNQTAVARPRRMLGYIPTTAN